MHLAEGDKKKNSQKIVILIKSKLKLREGGQFLCSWPASGCMGKIIQGDQKEEKHFK